MPDENSSTQDLKATLLRCLGAAVFVKMQLFRRY